MHLKNLRPLAAAVLVAFASGSALAQELKSEDEKTLYSLGAMLAKQLQALELTPEQTELVKRGLNDVIAGKRPAVDPDAYQQKIQQFANSRRMAQAEKAAGAGRAFADKAAKEKGAVKTDSGLVYLSLKDGGGATPKATDRVKVHYRGTLTDGREFDSSYARNEPAEFPLNGVIPCWTEGLQRMKAGGKAKLVCPPDIAYGDRGAGNVIPPKATLVFEVELLEVAK
jgi:FKBP-type peptidyl-prolyl cis-trans isomerase FkpA